MSADPIPANHVAIIDLWQSLHAFAEDISVSHNTAKGMRQRGWIPDRYWHDAVVGAERRGIEGVNLEVLARIARQRLPQAQDAA